MKQPRTTSSDRPAGRAPSAPAPADAERDAAPARKPFQAPRLDRHATLPELTTFGSLGDLWGW